MCHGIWRLSLLAVLSFCFPLFAALPGRAPGAEPPTKARPQPGDFTHVIVGEPVYYTTGPQQGRPPDGRFQAGTKVKVLRTAGSFIQVRAENGVTAYVSADAVRKLGDAAPVKITDDVRAIAQANNQFACDLYQRLHEREGNLFFSPASISTALAMTYAGAAGATQKQMGEVLHFELPEPRLHAGYGVLTEILNSQQSGYRLNMANRLWAQKGYPFQPEFLALTRSRYRAEAAQVDFVRQSEQARQTINAWVAEQTRGRIEDLIPPGVLNSMTRLVLTNAIYFKGAWEDEFSKEATHDAPFHLSGGEQAMVPMMRQTERFGYAESEDLQLLSLPYAGGELSMVILLPRQNDGLSALEPQLTAEKLQAWTSRMPKREVQVHLPRFKLTSQFTLSETLQALGMKLAFSDQADFSAMSTAEALTISEVIHKAFVDVNEEGTEAAAATGVVVEARAAPIDDEPVVFRADHPFVFLIRDNRTGAVLFLGRVTNPKG